MGIDRHEWEHRNYKSGRDKAVKSVELDDPGPLPPDSGLVPDEAPLQPEPEKKPVERSRKRPTRAGR
jgi:hypothetical protein